MQKDLTRVILGEEAREKLYAGIETAAAAITCTLGPKGKTVLIQKEGEAPIVTKDGVTVSRSIRLKDPVARMGADLIKEAATRTNDVAGDGTTTATVLTHAMVKEGIKLLGSGHSSLALSSGIELAVTEVVARLKASAKIVETSNEIAQVATISANGDRNIGELIAAAIEKVGRDGIITVEDAKGTSTSLIIVEGMQFERGYLSPYFVTNQERMNASYADARILVTDKKISDLRELVPILEQVVRSSQPLLIVADDVDGEALNGLVLNRVKGNIPVVAVKAPGYGQHREELLNDICVLTGATLVSSKLGTSLTKITINDLGTCKKLIVDAKSTMMVGANSASDELQAHVEELKKQCEDVTLSEIELNNTRSRIAKLSSGVAVIKVGGTTELDMIERKYRIEDALNATRAAADEGVVPGGGSALYFASGRADFSSFAGSDVAAGIQIVTKACEAPLRKIAENAGQSPDVVLNYMLTTPEGHGYDALNNKTVDMFDAGIIDPVKVCRTALQNAAAVATTFLSLDAVICDEETDDDKN